MYKSCKFTHICIGSQGLRKCIAQGGCPCKICVCGALCRVRGSGLRCDDDQGMVVAMHALMSHANRQAAVQQEKQRLASMRVKEDSALAAEVASISGQQVPGAATLEELLRRPHVHYRYAGLISLSLSFKTLFWMCCTEPKSGLRPWPLIMCVLLAGECLAEFTAASPDMFALRMQIAGKARAWKHGGPVAGRAGSSRDRYQVCRLCQAPREATAAAGGAPCAAPAR